MDTSAPVLIVIDVQEGFLDSRWGPTDNPMAEENIRALLTHWRALQRPIVLVRHDSAEPGSPLAPGTQGNALQPGIDGVHDLLVTKSVNSAFYGEPDLNTWLREHGHNSLVICGLITNHCCETTARMAGNLGYDVTFVIDATRTFDMTHPDGNVIAANDLSRATAASLDGEFATVMNTSDLLSIGSD